MALVILNNSMALDLVACYDAQHTPYEIFSTKSNSL